MKNRYSQEQLQVGTMQQQQQRSITPSAIQTFAAAEEAKLTSLASAITNLGTGITALDALITQLQNSAGTITPEDQALLDQIQAHSQALVDQATAISTTAPGGTVPITPLP